MSQLKVYYASVSSSIELKKHQQKIIQVLEAKKIAHTLIDITQGTEFKDEMRRIAGNATALPPQICNGDQYCGDYEGFANAIEEEGLTEFLRL